MKLFITFIVLGLIILVGAIYFGTRPSVPSDSMAGAAVQGTQNVQGGAENGQNVQQAEQQSSQTSSNTNTKNMNEFSTTDTKIGTGAEAVAGKKITVNYTGKLQDGTVFDSSIPRGEPFVFTLGAGQVIQGWEQGFAGMKVGGTRTIVVPPDMGYGARAVGSIPANSTLIFEVELLKVE